MKNTWAIRHWPVISLKSYLHLKCFFFLYVSQNWSKTQCTNQCMFMCVCVRLSMTYEWNSITCFISALARHLFERIYFAQRQHFATVQTFIVLTMRFRLNWSPLDPLEGVLVLTFLTYTCSTSFIEHSKGYTQVIWIWLSIMNLCDTSYTCFVY